MKQLRNPTDVDVQITIGGVDYVAPANGASDPVTDEVAEKWRKTHEFLVAEDADFTTFTTAEAQEAADSELKAEIKEEEKAEEPEAESPEAKEEEKPVAPKARKKKVSSKKAK